MVAKIKSHIHPLAKSVRYALNGINEAIHEEPNLRIHIFIAILAIISGVVLSITKTEWLFLLATITLVLILELLNTSLEALTDLASPGIHPKAKLAKDVAAGAVLLTALFSVVVGIVIFLPKILKLI